MTTRLIIRRITIGLAIVALVPLSVFTVLNAADYLKFHQTVRRAERLSDAQLRSLADLCRDVTKHQKMENGGWPREFDSLRPIRVSMAPGLSYASLYALGDVYLEFRVESTPHNQRIYFFTNSSGPQKTTVLWEKVPAAKKDLDPEDRVVSISGYGLGFYREWIVQSDRIMVVERPSTVGSDDRLLAAAAIDNRTLSAISRLAESAQKKVGGMVFHTPVADGIAVAIRFASKGDPNKEQVVLHNAWNDEISSLVDAVSSAAPAGYSIEYGRMIKEGNEHFREDLPVSVTTIAQWHDERPQTPWWSVWRTILRKFP